ncbi:hypothetical protein [Streptomyces sp. NPDC088789]|uniref:hypothetical protein n=1 Tax=Streptomyces sp. NPDC088789 TaxID=3365899 RepID=UPI0037F1CEDD
MNARDRVLRFVEENHDFLEPWGDPDTGFFVDDWKQHLGGLLDQYAHELADQQRAALERGPGATGRSLADLIDPSASLVRPDEEPTP